MLTVRKIGWGELGSSQVTLRLFNYYFFGSGQTTSNSELFWHLSLRIYSVFCAPSTRPGQDRVGIWCLHKYQLINLKSCCLFKLVKFKPYRFENKIKPGISFDSLIIFFNKLNYQIQHQCLKF